MLLHGAKFSRTPIFADWLLTSFCRNNFHRLQLLPSLIFIRWSIGVNDVPSQLQRPCRGRSWKEHVEMASELFHVESVCGYHVCKDSQLFVCPWTLRTTASLTSRYFAVRSACASPLRLWERSRKIECLWRALLGGLASSALHWLG